MPSDAYFHLEALNDFREARNRAALQKVLARLTGKSVDLLPFDEITYKLRGASQSYRGLQEIPVDKIVGSVSRYEDYTRDFWPLRESDRDRWARVRTLMGGLEGIELPPIEVYQIGEVYFVQDGHHRVSVARKLKQKFIEARIIEVKTKIPFDLDESPDDLIIKGEYADFLEKTRIDALFPDVDLRLTIPGLYKTLEKHIEVHRYYMGLERQQEIDNTEAVEHWYNSVYLSVAMTIREQGLLHEFPGRTEADLYIWISDHQAHLQKDIGWLLRPEVAAADLADRLSPRFNRVIQRFGRRLYDAIIPDELENNPPVGTRQEDINLADHLVNDILVPVDGEEGGWNALDQAFALADRESANLLGLYVLPEDASIEDEKAQQVCHQFVQRCQARQHTGQLALANGKVSRLVCERALLTDIVVLNLAHPPSEKLLKRLSSGFRTILRRCARPVLAVPGPASPLDRLLLAYDGSPKGNEALFFAAYFASRCCIPLCVVTVEGKEIVATETLNKARIYLEAHQLNASYLPLEGGVATGILDAAQKQGSNLIIMGGYGATPLVEAVVGSTVDQILRQSTVPILICQ